MQKKYRLVGAGLFGIMLVCRSAGAGELPIEINAAVGLLLPAEAEVDVSPPRIQVTTPVTWLVKGGVDIPVIPDWCVSSRLMYSSFTLGEGNRTQLAKYFSGSLPTEISGLQVSLGPKASIVLDQDFTLKLGLYGGYRVFHGNADIASSQGFALDGAAELHLRLGQGWSQFWELGVLTQPYGGKQDYYYLTFGPVVYFMAGLNY